MKRPLLRHLQGGQRGGFDDKERYFERITKQE
jgi:hypothetical protein